jgi:hypothetical protein
LGTAVALLVTPPASAEHRTDNRAYIGIAIPFGDGKSHMPRVAIGAQSLRVNTSDSVTGVDVNAHLNLFSASKEAPIIETVRLGVVGGNRDVQGIIGGGYSFADNKPLVSGAVQVPYVRGTADYIFDKGFGFSIEANTLKKPREVDKKEANLEPTLPPEECPP